MDYTINNQLWFQIPLTNTVSNAHTICYPINFQTTATFTVNTTCTSNNWYWYDYEAEAERLRKIDQVLDKLDSWRIHES